MKQMLEIRIDKNITWDVCDVALAYIQMMLTQMVKYGGMRKSVSIDKIVEEMPVQLLVWMTIIRTEKAREIHNPTPPIAICFDQLSPWPLSPAKAGADASPAFPDPQ